MTLGDVAALRGRLWAAGYRPIPVYSADAGLAGAGKRPRGDAWQDPARRDPPAAAVEWPESTALNTGILCDGLRVVDVDIDDAALASEVHAVSLRVLGKTLTRSRANSPRVVLLYQAAEGTPPKSVTFNPRGKVEVLGRGQQFVAFGVHPTGAALTWAPSDPTAIAVGKLFAISEEQITAFLQLTAPLIGTVPPRPPRKPPLRPIARHAREQLAGLVRVVASTRAVLGPVP